MWDTAEAIYRTIRLIINRGSIPGVYGPIIYREQVSTELLYPAVPGIGQEDRHSHLTGALVLTLSFAFVEAVAGYFSGSLALISDAGHMFTDSTALGLAAMAAWLARRPPSPRHT